MMKFRFTCFWDLHFYRIAIVVVLLIVAVLPLRSVQAWSDPLWVLNSVYDETITSGVPQELRRVNSGLTDPIAPYRVSCTSGTGTVTLDAPGTGTDLSVELDCTGAGTFTTILAPDFRVYANTGMTGHVTVDYYSLRAGCSQVYMAADDSYTMTGDATVWSVEGHLVINTFDVLPLAGNNAPWEVMTGDVIDNDQNLLNGNRPDILIICEAEPTPTSTPQIPSNGCATYASTELWNGAGYSDRIELNSDLTGYSITLLTQDRAPSIAFYQSDRNTPVGESDFLLYNTPFLVTTAAAWTFIDEYDPYSVEICEVGEVATPTRTSTSTRTAIPTPNVSGITMTPVPECRTVSVSFDSFVTNVTTSPPYTESTFALYKSATFTMSSNEYLVAVDRADSSGAQTGMINVGDMKSPDAMFTNFQVDVDGVPFEEVGGAYINATAQTQYRTYYNENGLSGAFDALYTPNATLRVWFKNDHSANQIIDHYEICQLLTDTPTPTITSNPLQLTPTITATDVITCDCVLVAPITPPTQITGVVPDLALELPTLRVLNTPTAVLSPTQLPFFTPLARAGELLQTPAALLEAAGSDYDWDAAQTRATEIAGRLSGVMEWIAIANPQNPAWSSVGGPLWAISPLVAPLIPMLSLTFAIAFVRFLMFIAKWVLKLVDLVFQLIQSIPFV